MKDIKGYIRVFCLSVILFNVLLFSNCVPSYVPNVINTPLFSNQGELQLGIHTGISGTDPQFAYALTDKIGLMLNGSFANRTSDSSTNFHKHNFVEIGTGYYLRFSDNGRFEVFGGLGTGNLHAQFKSGIFSSSAKVTSNRLFIQPAIGAKTNIFDGSFATRFVVLNLSQGTKNLTAVYIEPAITAKAGYKYVKAVFQFGMSLPLSQSATNFYYQPFLFSIGLQGFIGMMAEKSKF